MRLKILKIYIKKKLRDHERILLISAITQIVFLNFKEYAVINCSVEISKKLKLYPALINASLKAIAKNKKKLKDIKIDYQDLPQWFRKSSTNGRIEDLRDAAKILKDKKIASHVKAMVVPGSGLVKEQAEQEGLDKIFLNSGFEWREPGCSMCLAMNADKLKPEERCASTSNRNFEGRQGRGGRTHLVSPAMAAAAAISGNFDDVRKYKN